MDVFEAVKEALKVLLLPELVLMREHLTRMCDQVEAMNDRLSDIKPGARSRDSQWTLAVPSAMRTPGAVDETGLSLATGPVVSASDVQAHLVHLTERVDRMEQRFEQWFQSIEARLGPVNGPGGRN